jgi:hypothetical protein
MDKFRKENPYKKLTQHKPRSCGQISIGDLGVVYFN